MVARCWKVVVGVLGKLLWVCWDSCCGCVADRCTTVLFVSGVCVSLLSSPLTSPFHLNTHRYNPPIRCQKPKI